MAALRILSVQNGDCEASVVLTPPVALSHCDNLNIGVLRQPRIDCRLHCVIPVNGPKNLYFHEACLAADMGFEWAECRYRWRSAVRPEHLGEFGVYRGGQFAFEAHSGDQGHIQSFTARSAVNKASFRRKRGIWADFDPKARANSLPRLPCPR